MVQEWATVMRRRKRQIAAVIVGFIVVVVPYGAHRISWAVLSARTRRIRVGDDQAAVLAIMGHPTNAVSNPAKQRDVYWYKPYCDIYFRKAPRITILFLRNRVADVEEYPDAKIQFTPDDWKRSKSDRRGCMVDDLLRRYNLRGLKRSEILALLGPPDENTNGLVYKLGVVHMMDLDEACLIIRFDRNGNGESVSVN